MATICENGVNRPATAEEESQIQIDLLDNAKFMATKRIYDGFEKALNKDVVWDTFTFDNNEYSRAALIGTLTKINAGLALPVDFEWRDAGNIDRPFSNADVIGLGQAMFDNEWAAHQQKRTLLTQLAAATTIAEYDAIVWA